MVWGVEWSLRNNVKVGSCMVVESYSWVMRRI